MWFLTVLLVGALAVQGDLKVFLEQSVIQTGDSTFALELSYEIPHSSLAFVRDGAGFAAQYQVGVQALDQRREVVAGDLWHRVVRARRDEGRGTGDGGRESVETGSVALPLPGAVVQVRAEFSDRASERRAVAVFRVERPSGGLNVRLYDSSGPLAVRRYGIGDTLAAVAEPAGAGVQLDSCRFSIRAGRRLVASVTLPAGAGNEGRFEYPLADTSGVVRFGGGEYALEVLGFGSDTTLKARTSFRLDVPFFLDDSAYERRVAQLMYVADAGEMKHLRTVLRHDREQAWREFWRKQQESAGKVGLTEQEYFTRVDYAEERFGHGDRGYRSDRGRIYIRHGSPDLVESRPYDLDSPARETWYYYRLSKNYEFTDRYGTGQYVLLNRPGWTE